MNIWSSKALEASARRAHRVFSLWMFGDVMFAVIPIITIAIITGLLGSGFREFLLIKEWSFATIVFFGVAIRKFIRLKVQQTPTSYKLDTGVQLYMLLLIISVLVLSFVILVEKGIITHQEKQLLSVSQISLFLLGISSILIAVWAEDRYYADAWTLPDEISKHWLLRRIIAKVEHANATMDYVVYAVERASTIKFREPDSGTESQQEEETLYLSLRSAIDRLEHRISEGKSKVETVKSIPQAPMS